MHELSITQQIVSIAEKHARDHEAERVTDLYLTIGELSSVIDDSVEFYWDMVAQGTLCEGAELHFQRVPAEIRCRECGHTYGLPGGELTACPSCGSARIEVLRGKEFQLASMDID